MEVKEQLIYDIEVHSAKGIRNYFERGGNPNDDYNGVPIFTIMTEMYLRSPRFKDCIRAFIEFGLNFNDEALLAVLSDDAEKLEIILKLDASVVTKTYAVHNNAFTPLTGVTLLHYCAEYNHVDCAKVLLRNGADVNAIACFDDKGFNGHSPMFHAVAQHDNNSRPILNLLIENSADPLLMVKGLVWGKGYEWETFIPAVNPLSYAMMGLLPQMHRNATMIADNISLLLNYAYDMNYELPNIPNAYLK